MQVKRIGIYENNKGKNQICWFFPLTCGVYSL